MELKGKLGMRSPWPAASVRDDAVSALVNLGYPVRAAEEVVGELLRGARRAAR